MHVAYHIICLILLFSVNAFASGAFPVSDEEALLIGAKRSHTVKENETLVELARAYNVGYNEIVSANSGVDPWVPDAGTRITVPAQWLVPERLEEGLLINLAELRLYFFFTIGERRYIKTYPIGIGVEGTDTPLGDFMITAMVKDPVWHVPPSIRKENPELPFQVPPGPENPLGGYWIHLSVNGYGIHGTNRPLGIGRRVSHGCIRLYPEDIESLFKLVKPGTPVKIISEPVKAGVVKGKVYIEVHRSEENEQELLDLAMEKISRKRLLNSIDTVQIIKAVKSATGLPAVISGN